MDNIPADYWLILCMLFADSSVCSPAPFGGRFLMTLRFRHSPYGSRPPACDRSQIFDHSTAWFWPQADATCQWSFQTNQPTRVPQSPSGLWGLWVTGCLFRCGQTVGKVWAVLLSTAYPWTVHSGLPVIHKSTDLHFLHSQAASVLLMSLISFAGSYDAPL